MKLKREKGRVTDNTNSAQWNSYALPLLILTAVLVTACSTENRSSAASTLISDRPVAEGRVIESLGIRVSGLRLSSAGYMLDFRYQVVDADKAASLMDKKIIPYLVVDSTGIRLDIPDTPKLGRLRQTPRSGSVAKQRDYFIMFANLGRRLKSGDKVSMVVGDRRIENLSIQ